MGDRGPIPKRSDQRRRRNRTDAVPVDVGTAAVGFEIPAPEPSWHPLATAWYESLAASGQSAWYQPSDYATAMILAEVLSRELSPRPLVVGTGPDARVEMVTLPPSAGMVGAWLKGCTELLCTEGARRRYRLELSRPPRGDGGDLAWIDDARRRLHGTDGA